MTNNVIHGDCLNILKTIPNNSVDLVYLDPPFFTQKTHSLRPRDSLKKYSFSDIWASVSEYTSFLHVRLEEIHRVLSQTGSVFFHCNDRSSHIARFILDEIFGAEMFRSEIIWYYRRWSNNQKNLIPNHQTILFYSKTKNYKFNQEYDSYSLTTNVDQILQKRKRDKIGKVIYARNNSGEVIPSGIKNGVPLGDVWEIPFLNPKAKERIGYPTQKPILLLEKIINLVTDPNDTVLDPFCGSGTTIVAASLLGRNSIGIDISSEAIEITKNRLVSPVKTESDLIKKGEDSYKGINIDELKYLVGLNYIPVQRNKGIDAFLQVEINGVPIPVRIQKNNESLFDAVNLLYKAGKSKGASIMILIATQRNFDFGLEIEFPEEIIILDSTSLSISKILENKSITPDFPIKNRMNKLNN